MHVPEESDTPPLSVQRVRRVLSARQIEYLTAESGDTGVEFDDVTCWVSVGVDVLTIRADWPGTLPIERLEDVRTLLRRWHAEHYWPTASFGVRDDGSVTVSAQCAYDFESGAADRQIDSAAAMSCAKINELFREVSAL